MDNSIATILEILKYTIPSLITLIACNKIVKHFLINETKGRQLSLLKDNQEITVRLRLQAYERLTLFLERIHPRNLIPRIYESGMSAAELHAAMTFNIKTEFEHNLSQQIYVTKQVWQAVRVAKEQELNMINLVYRQLKPDSSGKEMHAKIIDYIMTVDSGVPTDNALAIINEEAKLVLSYGVQD